MPFNSTMTSSFSNYSNFIDNAAAANDDHPMAALYTGVAVLVAALAYYYTTVSVVKDRKVVESTDENNTRGLYGTPAILGVGTSNPPEGVGNERSGEFLERYLKMGQITQDQVDFTKRIRDTCGIKRRYSGINVEENLAGEGLYGKTLEEPADRRHDYWEQHAKQMAIEAAKNAIENWGGDKLKITHVVFHSCTGFKAPGIELDVVDALNLTGVQRRLGINFMGCFGGFTALSVAKSYCLSDPGAITLVICAEACAAHITNSENRSELLGSVIFADGGAACIIGPGQAGDWSIGKSLTKTMGLESRDMMTWRPTPQAYKMFLSKDIGNVFGVGLLMTVRTLIKTVLGDASIGSANWCVHPGGKGLLDGLAKGIGAEKLRHSYKTLENFGNMSSPTIFFVIKSMLEEHRKEGSTSNPDAICLGFGPGLTAELCALHKIM